MQRRFSANTALFVTVLLAIPVAAAEPTSLVVTAKNLFKDVRRETLPNGLQVYLLPVKSSPVVTTMVTYKVGSCDEEKDQTGLSHYLEHLMFKGTDKLLPGDVDRATQRNGGRNNAYTSEDLTAYHFDFAADRWTIALDIEADRMRNVKIDEKHEFEQEKGAVISELKGNEDQPWDQEYKAVLSQLYPKMNPYAHPVIGEEKHVRTATAEIIKRHYDKWYHPNNASLVVCGGFDPDEAMVKIRKLFGPIPKGELPARKPAPLHPARKEIVRKEMESKFDVPRLLMGFNTVASKHPDDVVFDVISDVLSTGKTSRLYKKLVDGERIANQIGASNSSGRYPGWFGIQVELLKGKNRKATEQFVFAELKRLATEPVGEVELNRIRRSILASFVFSKESVHSLCDLIATAATIDGLDDLNTYLDRVLAVTPADIQRVAAKYLEESSAVIVWTIPEDEKKTGATAPKEPAPAKSRMNRAEAGGGTFSLKDAKRVVLKNGMTLVLLENHRLPIVVATASVAEVRLQELPAQNGIATLMGDMLEEGTAKHTAEQISTLIEDTGGTLSLSSAGGSVKVLSSDAKLGLGLLFECLMGPTFPEEQLEAKRSQLLATIADSETQPQNRARNAFQATVYGTHPYGRPASGTKEIVSKITAKECREFHRKTFVPNRTTVILVGDFVAEEMIKLIEEQTAEWKPSQDKPITVVAPPELDGQIQKIISDPTASQTHVFIGHLGITRKNPDYYKLLVMDNVLGTGPGFTDRLSASLRDRQGLAYTVRATIADSAGEQPGTFTGYIGTFPEKFTTVRDGFMKEVNRIRDEPPTAQEVDDAKKYLLGSLPFRLTTSAQVAGELLAAERYGLGYDVLEKYREAVSKVTPADVQAVAKQYLNPKKIAIVAVGPINAAGKPLPMKAPADETPPPAFSNTPAEQKDSDR